MYAVRGWPGKVHDEKCSVNHRYFQKANQEIYLIAGLLSLCFENYFMIKYDFLTFDNIICFSLANTYMVELFNLILLAFQNTH